MKRIHTHYDNLKVARNAPPEVIRAAYRSLSQKYHPDRNPGDASAARVMAIINSSYEVLSNPDKRHEHDRWISQQEAQASESTSGNETVPPKTAQHGQSTHQSLPEAATGTIRGHISENWPRYILLGVFFWGIWALDKSGTPPPGPKPYTQTAIPVPSVPEYIRPLTAPNGELWPTSAAYVKGYPRTLVSDTFHSKINWLSSLGMFGLGGGSENS